MPISPSRPALPIAEFVATVRLARAGEEIPYFAGHLAEACETDGPHRAGAEAIRTATQAAEAAGAVTLTQRPIGKADVAIRDHLYIATKRRHP